MFGPDDEVISHGSEGGFSGGKDKVVALGNLMAQLKGDSPIGFEYGLGDILAKVIPAVQTGLEVTGAGVLRSARDLFTGNVFGENPPNIPFRIANGELSQPKAGGVTDPIQAGKGFYTPTTTMVNPEPNPIQRLVQGGSTPGNIIALPATVGNGVIPRIASGYFGASGVQGIGETLKTLTDSTSTPEQKKQAVESILLNLFMVKGGLHETLHATPIPSQPLHIKGTSKVRMVTPEGSLGTVGDYLRGIAGNKANPFNEVAKLLLDNPIDKESLDLLIKEDATLPKAGAYVPETRSVLIHPSAVANDMAGLHEIGHLMTEYKLRSPEFAAKMERLFKQAKEALDPGEISNIYGLKNVDEFTQEALTNPGFQQTLKGVRVGGGSLLDSFIDTARDLIGRPREKGSLLAEAKQGVKELLQRKTLANVPLPDKVESPAAHVDRPALATTPNAPRSSMSVVPIVGQRPMTWEEKVIQSGEGKPNPEAKIVPSYLPSGEAKQGGQISFNAPAEAKAVPSARQSAVDQGGTKLHSGLGIDPDEINRAISELRPALMVNGKPITSDDAETHADIFSKLVKDAKSDNEIVDLYKAFADDKSHVFERKGQVLERLPAGKSVGLNEGLHGEKLAELKKGLGEVKSEVGEGKGTSFHSGVSIKPEVWQDKEKELRGKIFALTGPRFATTPSLIGFTDTTKEVDSNQLWNRLKNKLSPDEVAVYEETGVKDEILKKGKVSPEEAAKLMQERGPRVEVEKMGEGAKKLEPEQQEFSELTHTWLDSNSEKGRFRSLLRTKENLAYANAYANADANVYADANANAYANAYADVYEDADAYMDVYKDYKYRFLSANTPELRQALKQQLNSKILSKYEETKLNLISKHGEKAKRYFELYDKYGGKEDQNKSHWSSISPKSESDMKGYVEGAVTVPLIKHDLPTHFGTEAPKFPSSHSFPPNTLGFFRGYMEERPDGGKTFHVIEVQSDWAQRYRQIKGAQSTDQLTGDALEMAERSGVDSLDDAEKRIYHPLLPHWERLTLKAAIDHAKEQGADRIAVSDAETAMMSEGHDRQLDEIGNPLLASEIKQSKGMRLHYDQILPRLLEELTGTKGERVEFGDHKMAMQDNYNSPGDPPIGKIPRQDLIFRNPDSTPKTSISARSFPLDKAEGPFSLFDKDKPNSKPTYYYSGIPVPEVTKVYDDVKKWFKGSPMSDNKKWSPMVSPDVMKQELLNNPDAKPISTKSPGETLPSYGPETSMSDRLAGTTDKILQGVYSTYNLVNKGDKIYSPMDVVFDMLDGGKATFDGAMFRNIRWPLDFDFNVELNMRDRYISPVRDLVSKHNLTDKNGFRLGIYATVQQGMRDRLVEQGISNTYIDNTLKTMTPQELEVYRVARKQLDSLLPGVQQVAKDVYKMDVTPVENYFPLQRDWRKVKPKAPEQAKPRGGEIEDEAIEFLNADFTKRGNKTEQGFTIERVPDAKTAVKLNFFDVYERHVRDVAHFVSSQRRLNDIGKVVRDQKFQDKYGDYGQKLVMDWLNNYAKQGRTVSSLATVNALRKNFARGVLGFRVASQFVHLANVPLGMQRAGPTWYVRGMSAAMSEEGQIFLHKNLAETFERGGGEMEVLSAKGPVETAAFAPQRALDRWNSQATVMGIYLRKLEESGKDPGDFATTPPDYKALAEARVLARRAVASPLYKDLPPVLNKPAGKIVMQFQNTFMDQWSNIRYDFPQYLRNNPKQAMGLAISLAGMVLVESGIKYGAKKGGQAITGYTPKSAEDDTYWKKVQHEALRRIPGAGQLISSYEYGTSPIPVAELAGDVVKSARTLKNADDGKQKALAGVQLGTAALEVAGVPGVGQASELVQNKMKAGYFKTHEKRVEDVAKKERLNVGNFNQRVKAEQKYQNERPAMSDGERIKSAESALKKMEVRRQAVVSSMSKEDQAWLKVNNIRAPGFGNYMSEAGTRIAWTEAETKAAEEVYRDAYAKAVAYLRNSPGFKSAVGNAKQVKANEIFLEFAKDARERVTSRIETGKLVPNVGKTKKRFSAFSNEGDEVIQESK